MKRIYTVWANEDRTEGKGRNKMYYICSNEQAALGLAKGMGPMGMSDGYVEAAIMYDAPYERDRKFEQDMVRQEALSKLTEEEKKALGVK